MYSINILIHTGKGRGRVEEKVKEATVYKAGSKILTLLTVSPIYKLLPQSPFTGQFF
jgi:hypothetical protein